MENKRRKRISSYAGMFNLRMLAAVSGQQCIFPFYHTVSCKTPSHIRHLYKIRSEKEFSEDMEYLLKYFEPISISDYQEGRTGKKRQMVLSFDDGLVECHEFIAPFLKQKGIPAVFHLNNDFVDNRGLFYRYKASMLIDHLATDKCHVTRAAEYLSIPEEQVIDAILMISSQQVPLLETLAMKLEFDEALRLREHPVYMSSSQVKDLIDWGFTIGAHGSDHAEFFRMESRNMAASVDKSMKDIQMRFGSKPACFAFPFSSDGVPEDVIDQLLEENVAEVVFGTSGLKLTGKKGFIQRIPMESLEMGACRMLKTEYLYYVMKMPLGRNRYFKSWK